MERPYYVVDAFASEPFTGNPAAVVLETRGLDDRSMQAIAAEFNLSETTFVLPATETPSQAASLPPTTPDGSVRFRWFTPTTEVDMCGHATVAGVHALLESGYLSIHEDAAQTTVRIETRLGTLHSFVEPIPRSDHHRMIWLDLLDPVLQPLPPEPAELASILSLPTDALDSSSPPVKTQDRDVLLFVKDVARLNEARPDFARLATWLRQRHHRGLCLATANTLSPSIHVQSRFFAPADGVDEDPVTGSVHGPLAVHLVQRGHIPLHDDLAGLTCVQSKAGGRAGLVQALVQKQQDGAYAVRIGGQAVTTMHGLLHGS